MSGEQAKMPALSVSERKIKKYMKRKYVKDYKEKEYEQKLPGRKKEYVYTGSYFVRTYEKDRRSLLSFYCVLGAILGILWLVRGIINNEGMYFALTELPYVFELIPLVYLYRGIFSSFVYSKERLERFQYDESVQRIAHSTIALLILEGIGTVGEIIFLIKERGDINWRSELLFLACSAASMIFVWYLQKLGKKNPCKEEKK